MKLIWIAVSLSLLSACTEASTAQAPPAYDSNWHMSEGWPGEYPQGITILKESVVLDGRAKMDKASAKSIKCPVPKGANYNQWNYDRVTTDKLKFVSASRKFTVTVNAQVKVLAVDDDTDVTLDLKQGETLTYLTYIAEGFALMSYKGKEYQINEADFDNKATFGSTENVADDLWVNIPCAGDARGWVLHAEVQGVDGIGETQHTEYGASRDLP